MPKKIKLVVLAWLSAATIQPVCRCIIEGRSSELLGTITIGTTFECHRMMKRIALMIDLKAYRLTLL